MTDPNQQPKKYRILYDRKACIGAAACAAVTPEFWTMVEDGKADLTDGKKIVGEKHDDELFERKIEQKDFQKNMDAAQVCPVNAIHIIDEETGEKLI